MIDAFWYIMGIYGIGRIIVDIYSMSMKLNLKQIFTTAFILMKQRKLMKNMKGIIKDTVNSGTLVLPKEEEKKDGDNTN